MAYKALCDLVLVHIYNLVLLPHLHSPTTVTHSYLTAIPKTHQALSLTTAALH